jgi:hypothetical protein
MGVKDISLPAMVFSGLLNGLRSHSSGCVPVD